jgi:ubiquinone/menaquinone biosynthesis C-methylase UbiE
MSSITTRHGIIYQRDEHGKPITYKRWLGDFFAAWYDGIMQRSIFPKKFQADYHQHFAILRDACAEMHNLTILELACGSGNAVEFLPNDNQYIGTDISPGLLKIAIKKLTRAGFKKPQFHICNVANLPFAEAQFDVVMCHLSLNFFPSPPTVLAEIKRLLKPDGTVLISVPLLDAKQPDVTIRGTLYTQQQLQQLCNQAGLQVRQIDATNGCLGYFRGGR